MKDFWKSLELYQKVALITTTAISLLFSILICTALYKFMHTDWESVFENAEVAAYERQKRVEMRIKELEAQDDQTTQ